MSGASAANRVGDGVVAMGGSGEGGGGASAVGAAGGSVDAAGAAGGDAFGAALTTPGLDAVPVDTAAAVATVGGCAVSASACGAIRQSATTVQMRRMAVASHERARRA